ncbi:TPA: hypothetical protein RPW15_000630 [Campylobacter fetus subsp. venerealis]|uniref:CorA family divalent cation transporter n=1 Tax=Campylobacter fetus TaxID=196 RepID=UPI00190968AC|nr:CorA family divalent cation transporter [Campylobacter fetus]MBK3485900.1 hypothetical protein [Campylobacter fetus subsp. venerealis]HDX6254805.1 hypothetical protein [Campylobacter fetus subsp. venerealis]HDX6282174.1 hypothetical protein [Campylobacter fetus subsp. venerealis]HDX6282942.1 hypothetical protein [Campylobacter fetus subsp. venerealis]HDX6285252.1 hypothetical protein [Campylobacter fetus subsp. venerealis]
MINDEHRKKLEKASSRSGYFSGEGYKLLIISTDFHSQNAGFVFLGDEIFEKNGKEFIKVDFAKFETAVKSAINYFRTNLDKYEEEVLSTENLIYKNKFDSNFLEKYFKLKHNFSIFTILHQYFMIALNEFVDEFINYKKEFKNDIQSLKRIDKIIDDTASRLAITFSYYNSLKDKKHNKNLYILTVISAFFLPLNLITGFFGMNTGDMFLSGKYGTTIVLLFIIFIIITAIFYIIQTQKNHKI